MADYDRFRSFAERYVIERATHFEVGKEREMAWNATLDAKTIYKNIAVASKDAEPEEMALPTQGQQTSGNNSVGATGPSGVARPMTNFPPHAKAAVHGLLYGKGGSVPSPVKPPPPKRLVNRILGIIGLEYGA